MAKCFARKQDGEQCGDDAIDGALYCSRHRDYEHNHSANLDDIVRTIRAEQARNDNPKKDGWDKLSALSTIISGVIIGFIGIAATSSYNNRQLEAQQVQQHENVRIRRIEIAQKFFDHLTSDRANARKGALLSIAALGDEEFATKLASNFDGPASREALVKLAASSDPAVAQSASRILSTAELFTTSRNSVPRVEVKAVAHGNLLGNNERYPVHRRGTGFIVSKLGYVITAGHLLRDIEDPSQSDISVFVPGIGAPLPAHIVRIDTTRDVALLRMKSEQTNFEPLIISNSDPKPQEDLFSVGYRAGELEGTILNGRHQSQNGPRGTWAATLAAPSGFSGAPVILPDGKVVGYVVGGSRETDSQTHYRPLREIRDILAILSPP